MFLGEMKIRGRYTIKETFYSCFILMFHSCVFHRLPMALIQKHWNQEGNFPGFVCLVGFFFLQFVLIPGITITQMKITGYLQGNAEFLPLNFPSSLYNAYQCSCSIFTGSGVPYHFGFIRRVSNSGQKMSDLLCEKHTDVYDILGLS